MNGKKFDKIQSNIKEVQQKYGGHVKSDSKGKYCYRFDPAHKDVNIHLEKYQKINGKWKNIGKVDPNTLEILKVYTKSDNRK